VRVGGDGVNNLARREKISAGVPNVSAFRLANDSALSISARFSNEALMFDHLEIHEMISQP
jgi:hypothetical protein